MTAPDESVPGVALFDLLRRRRMHRVLSGAPVAEAQLEQLAWAASRAPMGGNQLMRRILIVTDERLIEVVRLVTPSFGATGAAAVIVLCTDLIVAEERMGTLGRDLISLIDAGAAAENVALAAATLQLGVSFIRSANEAALRPVLELPAEVRPDILIAVGHPSSRPGPAAVSRRPDIYRDTYGQPWKEIA
ncbi:MAG: nitroreductase family protein [Solirubrobacteraceae bacterium]